MPPLIEPSSLAARFAAQFAGRFALPRAPLFSLSYLLKSLPANSLEGLGTKINENLGQILNRM